MMEAIKSLQDVYQFSKEQPQLEHLEVTLEDHGTPQQVPDDWTMPNVRTLKFRSPVADEELIIRIAEAVPNVEQVHLDISGNLTDKMIQIGRLKHLKKLWLTGHFTDKWIIWQHILKNCEELQSLAIACLEATEEHGFPIGLFFNTDHALNLIDLALCWRCSDPRDLMMALLAVQECPKIRRVAIYCDMRQLDKELDLEELRNDVQCLVNEKEQLEMFCLVLEGDWATFFDGLVVNQRPTLWCHLGNAIPHLDSTPELHQDLIQFLALNVSKIQCQ